MTRWCLNFFFLPVREQEKKVSENLSVRGRDIWRKKNVSFSFFFRKTHIFYSLDWALSFDRKKEEDSFWGE